MPTGYTEAIRDDITFDDFVMRCARGFGALISMRDDSLDAPIPDEFKPSDWHIKQLAEVKAELSKIQHLSDDAASINARVEYENALMANEERIKNAIELRKKYNSRLSQVKAWQPPTSDHTGLKDFMIDQITVSIKSDCDVAYWKGRCPKLLDGKTWVSKKIKELTASISYHEEGYAKELSCVASRNAWVRALRASLSDTKHVS